MSVAAGVGVATTGDAGARVAVLHTGCPTVHWQAVGKPLSPPPAGEPGIGETPAQGRVFLAVVHVLINALRRFPLRLR